MSIIDKLKKSDFWNEFLEYKIAGEHLSDREEKDLREFISSAEYLPVAEDIEKSRPFPLPRIREINKKSSGKKRRVFVFDRKENYILKAVDYLLDRYDHIFSKNLYSFRKNIGVKKAIADLVRSPKIGFCYSYKVDISDYFNSVDTDMVLTLLGETLKDDRPLYDFISGIISEPAAISGDGIVHCRKGIMAGVPVSGFLANLYLKELDEWFAERNIIYARYSDDIIVFAPTAELVFEYECKIKDFLSEKKLDVNERKEYKTAPGQPWEFLGFRVDGDGIDLASISLEKMKDKMRRKSKALVRWKKRKKASDERAISAFIRHFNRKFYDNPKHHEITWCRWYFPTITTSKSLHILDEYMISCIRYIATGKHTKANYNLRYEEIKAMGYRSLVNAFYHYKKTNSLNPSAELL